MIFKNLIQYTAPVFFMIMAGLRCYLETSVFGTGDYFSYYVFFHHVLWYLSAMLCSILVLNLILKIPFEKLNILFYSGIILMIPVIHSAVTGELLHLTYLKPNIITIFKSTLSACLLHPSNKAQFIEIILIDVGIFAFSYFHGRTIKKSFFATLAVHCILTCFGIQWFYSGQRITGLFKISTNLPPHVWLSFIWLATSTFLVQIILFKDLQLEELRSILTGIISGLFFGFTTLFCFNIYTGLTFNFNTIIMMLPIYSIGFLIFLAFHPSKKVFHLIKTVFIVSLLIQLMVVLPILLNLNQSLLLKPAVVPF